VSGNKKSRGGVPVTAADRRRGVLAGVRVLDLTRVLSGPFCTMLLADQGAEVVKVEAPNRGDDARHMGPPFCGEASGFFVSVNRSKKSLTLNLKSARGVSLLGELAGRADVFVENFRPGVAERLGIGYEAMAAAHPEIVYASISGFGQTGPYRERSGYNITIQALSGVMTTSGPESSQPYPIGISLGDIPAGMFAAFAITTALYAREKTGRGQYIDVSMLDSLIAMMENPIVRSGISGEAAPSFGRHHPSITPYGLFDTADRPIALAIGNDRLWVDFCRVLGRPDLTQDPRFETNAQRTENADPLHSELRGIFLQRPAAEWVRLLLAAGLPVAPVNDIAALFSDPQVAARGMLPRVEQPGAGPIAVCGTPVRFGDAEPTTYASAPGLGEHTREVLATWLGMDEGSIGNLEKAGVV
jgi:crotonobetainyl-CoA:carnitine CoA-transferase CaiB-like acyl-CoA transferase